MDTLTHWFTSPRGLSLLESFAHSLWFGALLAPLVALVLRRIPTTAAQVRHSLILGAQALLLVFVCVTWAFLEHTPSSELHSNRPQSEQAIQTATSPVAATIHSATQGILPAADIQNSTRSETSLNISATNSKRTPTNESIRQYAGFLWLLGSGLILCWRVWQSASTHLWATRSTPINDTLWLQLLGEEIQRLHFRTRVQLRTAINLSSPAVIGILRPVILIPRELMDRPDSQFIRAILSHELAHLKRLDPLIVALQQVIEALLFFNPFVWTLSHWSKREREAACDATAASGPINSAEYGQMLLSLAKRQGQAPMAAQQAVDPRHPSLLKERIVRLLHPNNPVARGLPVRLTLTSIFVALAFVATTRKATLYAADVLSHAQRIELIASEAGAVEDTFPEIPDNAKLRVTSKVHQANGEPIQAIIFAAISRSNNGPTNHNGSRYNTEATAEKTWQFPLKENWQGVTTRLDSVTLHAFAPGLSSTQLVIDDFPPTNSERSVDLILKPALPARIEVINTEGEPIPNATIRYRYQLAVYGSVPSTEILSTNTKGIVKWNAPADTPLILMVSADGYLDFDAKNISFSPQNDHHTITLTPGPALTGRAIDRLTRQSIEGARIEYIVSDDTAFRPAYGWLNPLTLTQTNAKGDFLTHALAPNSRHWLVAKAPGYLTTFPGSADGRGIQTFDDRFSVLPSSAAPVTFELVPKKALQLEVIPPKGIAADQFKFQLRSLILIYGSNMSGNPWTETIKILNREQSDDGHIHLTIEPQVEAPIEIRSIHTPERSKRTLLNWKNDEPLVADFRSFSDKLPNETNVHLDFELPEDAAAPQGQIVINWQTGERSFQSQAFPINERHVNALLKDRLPGSPIQIFPLGMIGYYFAPIALDSPDNSIEFKIDQLVPAGAIRLQLKGTEEGNTRVVRILFNPLQSIVTPPESQTKTPHSRHSNNYMTIELPTQNQWRPRTTSPTTYPFRLRKGQDDLLITPVPLNTSIILEANQAASWKSVGPFTLVNEDAIREMTIQMPEGITFQGNLYDKGGAPEGERELTLIFYPKRNEGLPMRGYIQTAKTDEAGHFAFTGINPEATGKYGLEIKTERGHKTLASNVDIQKPFTFYLDRSYELQIKVHAEGQSLKGTILDWANRFPDSSSGPQSGRTILNESGEVTLNIKEPLVELHLNLEIDGKAHQKVIPLQAIDRNQFPTSIDFTL
ncbi:MAG TPA: hypothetical protein DEA90_05080 [Opitutae bacterium]|nr:hypothetical protein [Puniceicoccaceae bacterium]HBR93519.1 hypothetical protein [Opitutae bacterium]